jgi:hypothetical protein
MSVAVAYGTRRPRPARAIVHPKSECVRLSTLASVDGTVIATLPSLYAFVRPVLDEAAPAISASSSSATADAALRKPLPPLVRFVSCEYW